MNINNVTIAGRLTADPEITKIGEKETTKASFKVAVNRVGTEKTDFIPVVVMGKIAENCGKFLVKGQEVGVTGSIQVDSWKDGEGNPKSKTYVFADGVQFGAKPNGAKSDDYPGQDLCRYGYSAFQPNGKFKKVAPAAFLLFPGLLQLLKTT